MKTSALDNIATGRDNYEKYKDMFTDETKDVVTMDSFYKLLIAEMSNQDPLEPTSNTEFISQLASFTSLQAQQDNFAVQKQNYANSLVGQTVSVQGSAKDDLVTGVVESVSYGDEVMIKVDDKSYKLSAIKQVYGYTSMGYTEEVYSQIGNYGAFAAGILGKTVMVQAYDANGEVVIDRGTVSSLEIQDGVVRVIVNGMAYNVTDVVQVTESENPNASNSAADDDDDEELAVNTTTQKTESTPTEETPKTETGSTEQTGAVTERTDDTDIPDLTEDDTDDVPNTETAAQPENEQTNGQESWVTQGEASELYSLFGEN